jgi:hypothetical protein
LCDDTAAIKNAAALSFVKALLYFNQVEFFIVIVIVISVGKTAVGGSARRSRCHPIIFIHKPSSEVLVRPTCEVERLLTLLLLLWWFIRVLVNLLVDRKVAWVRWVCLCRQGTGGSRKSTNRSVDCNTSQLTTLMWVKIWNAVHKRRSRYLCTFMNVKRDVDQRPTSPSHRR